jgi:hypothetical protein
VALGVKVLTGEIAGVECLLRHAFVVDTHVLKYFYLRPKEEILQITSAAAGTIFGVGDGTVDVQFCVSHANRRRSNLLTSVKAIAANSHANATKFGFPRTHSANKVGVGNFASNRNLAGTNERNSISACDMLLRGTIV